MYYIKNEAVDYPYSKALKMPELILILCSG